MSEVNNNVFVLDSTLLDETSCLTYIGCKNSVVEDGSSVVWLETRQRYLTLETDDDSCMNQKYVKLNSVCWFEMKGYQFPPGRSSSRYLPPGSYCLVQRIRKDGGHSYFPGQIEFKLNGVSIESNEEVNIASFLFDIQLLQDIGTNEWHKFAVGSFTTDIPLILKLNVLSTNRGSWKYGFCWDYFEVVALKSCSLKENCISTILKHLKEKTAEYINKLNLPMVLISQLRNSADNPQSKLSLFNLNKTQNSDSDSDSDDNF